MRLTLGEVALATGGTLMVDRRDEIITGVSTDTRTLKEGDLFVALRGSRFDGHDYVARALRQGAHAALVKRGYVPKRRGNLIGVPDTLRALGDLASFWRRRFPIPVVAVTGSNGKTTTKEMVAALLRERYSVLKTEGNFNNQIGLPLTLFRMSGKHDLAVLEMGMNLPGEIRRLTEIAAPEVGIITEIGRAHLQGLRTIGGIAKAKGELLEGLPKDGLAILNRDDRFFPLLRRRSRAPVRTFGWNPHSDLRAIASRLQGFRGIRFEVRIGGRVLPFFLKTFGRHNVMNALAALAVADHFGLSPALMRRGLSRFRSVPGRMQIEQAGRWIVINDTYNANPDSMKRALEFLADLFLTERARVKRRVAILGEMLELGRYAAESHREVGARAIRKVDLLIGIGRQAKNLKTGALGAGGRAEQLVVFPDVPTALPRLSSLLQQRDLILVKGSRGMRMERVVQFLKRN